MRTHAEPEVCRTHIAYRSEHAALDAATRHLPWLCDKCRRGKRWHAFRCPHAKHWHTAHQAAPPVVRRVS